MKRCYRCGRELEESEFYRSTRRYDGLSGECKDCNRTRKNFLRFNIKEANRFKRSVLRGYLHDVGFKMCCTCKTILPYSDFARSVSDRKGAGYFFRCRKCCQTKRREMYCKDPDKYKERALGYRRRLKEEMVGRQRTRLYNLNQKDYDAMLEKQGGVCAICGDKEIRVATRLCVDHDHATGRIRGLLCVRCNHGLGHFKDSVGRLSRAIEYLSQTELADK
jgi:hypothetical protein